METVVDSGSSIKAAYEALAAEGRIEADARQLRVVEKLDVLRAVVTEYQRQLRHAGFLRKLVRKTPSIATRGLYIHGGVGRGKSMLMDLFFEQVPVERKRRVHFHAFMLEVHARLARYKERYPDSTDPLAAVAGDIADETLLLCFDEFQVSDIADAMIMGRLFTVLFDRGVVMVATSNRAPDELYAGGLQRKRFEPFIQLLKDSVSVVELSGPEDYRLKHLKSLSTVYFTPLGKRADSFVRESFASLTQGAEPAPGEIDVDGRRIEIRAMHGDVAVFSFEELCARPLGAADYLEIAREFGTVILHDIPKLGPEKRNEAKRFVTLIDALYEQKTKLICTAAAAPAMLYAKGDGRFEFDRTISRLTEMQSEQYLKLPHKG